MKGFTTLRTSRGFSLLEIMIVMVIIGLIAAMIGPELWGKLGKAKQGTAKTQIQLLMTSLDAYRLDVGSYPSQQEGLDALISNPGADGWSGPYLAKGFVPDDPWKHPYIYQNPGEHGEVDIHSLGADNRPGGTGEDADVASWE